MLQMQSHLGQLTGKSRTIADGLRKAGQFEAAADAYASIWPDGDQWTGWAYAFCLRKAKRSEEAIEVARRVLEAHPDFELVRSVYAWALFDTIRGVDELSVGLMDRADRVVALTARSERAYDRVSPFVATVLNTGRLLARKGRYREVLQWLDHLDPQRLTRDEFAFKDASGKERKLASTLERYYGLKTHALEKLARWEECLSTAEVALTACSPLHYDNDIWFARRIARAKVQLGNSDEGIADLTKLASRKPTSFLFFDIAEAAWNLGDSGTAFDHALLALQSPGKPEFKLAAILLMAKVLWARGEQDEARQHLSLYVAVRRENGWRIGNEVVTLSAAWNVPGEADADTLLRSLKPRWRAWRQPTQGRRSGVVHTVLPHGRAGFILAADHERFFFDTRDWKEEGSQPTQGSRVTFSTKPSFDRKRQRPSVVACDIRRDR